MVGGTPLCKPQGLTYDTGSTNQMLSPRSFDSRTWYPDVWGIDYFQGSSVQDQEQHKPGPWQRLPLDSCCNRFRLNSCSAFSSPQVPAHVSTLVLQHFYPLHELLSTCQDITLLLTLARVVLCCLKLRTFPDLEMASSKALL